MRSEVPDADGSGHRRAAWLADSWLTVALILLFVACLAVFAAIWIAHGRPADLENELAKAALQVGVASVAAAFVKLLVSRRDRGLARRANREEEIKDLLGRTTSAYNVVKRARRDMRALGRKYIEGTFGLIVDAYDKCLGDLNTAQLDLEAAISQIEDAPRSLLAGASPLGDLRAMEKCLGDLVSEYEEQRPRMVDVKVRSFASLDRLEALIGPAKIKGKDGKKTPGTFKLQFLDPYDRAMAAMRQGLRELAGG